MRAVKCIKLPEKDPPIWADGVTADQLFIVGNVYKERYISFGIPGTIDRRSIIAIVAELDAEKEAHIFEEPFHLYTVDYLLENFPDSFIEVKYDPSTT